MMHVKKIDDIVVSKYGQRKKMRKQQKRQFDAYLNGGLSGDKEKDELEKKILDERKEMIQNANNFMFENMTGGFLMRCQKWLR